jgi:hypothetical protein
MEPMSRALVYGENYDLGARGQVSMMQNGSLQNQYQHEKRIQQTMTIKKISHSLRVEKRPYLWRKKKCKDCF